MARYQQCLKSGAIAQDLELTGEFIKTINSLKLMIVLKTLKDSWRNMNTLDFITTLTGSPDTVCDWRLIDDRNKGVSAVNLRGTLQDLLPTLQTYNTSKWGVFLCINAMDGQGQSLPNVTAIRANVVDLDDPATSADAYNRAINSQMPPHMVVQTSPGKYHLYWLLNPYTGNDFYTQHQRKLIQLYGGDKHVTDATRVLRVPGFNHCKGEPVQVNCWPVSNRPRYTYSEIDQHLQHINIVQHFGNRKALGAPELAAPSLPWLVFALELFDPNDMPREDWVPLSSAFKQAGWTLADEQTLLQIWLKWCAGYSGDDVAENMKLWNSIRDTEVGWARFERLSMIGAYMLNHETPPNPEELKRMKREVQNLQTVPSSTLPPPTTSVIPYNNTDLSGYPILDITTKRIWFQNCYFIAAEGKIFSPQGRFMNSTQFNGLYGGKEFSLKESGAKLTDEPWKAALRASDWHIPKVDHVRFLPEENPMTIIKDRLGRNGINTYIPVIRDARQGDVSLWLDHINRVLPNPADRKIFCDYMAHMVRYPGYKIPWAILLQSVEGIGKTVFFEALQHALGSMYVYRPKAQELIASGSKFNAWMRAKLAIVVDEIKIDERRELIEILKPMITDREIEVQSKGVDQQMEDNAANWVFFSNYKDAIPISQNGRRYCVFYSAIQSKRDLQALGMEKDYFDRLYKWLREEGGLQAVNYWFLTYPIERGQLPVTAPETSSHAEALKIGRSPLEILIDDKCAAAERGFHNGYISLPMLMKAIAQSSMRSTPPEHIIRAILDAKGYIELGYTAAPVGGEDLMKPSLLFGLSKEMRIENY